MNQVIEQCSAHRIRRTTSRPWSPAELLIVEQNYGVLGPAGTQKLLPGRTMMAVQLRGYCLGIKAPTKRGNGGGNGRPVLAEEKRYDASELCNAFGLHPFEIRGARIIRAGDDA